MNSDVVLKEVARKHALKNAFDYGSADVKVVVGRVLGELPEAKSNMKATMITIAAIVSEVNKLPKREIEKQMLAFRYFEKKEEERKLRLENAVVGQVVTRFSPEPNGYAHIGHAKAAFLSAEFASEYNGKCFLRWDDTNPEKEKAEYVEVLRADMAWLGLEFEKEFYTSDLMDEFYSQADKLVRSGDAYVCFCDQDTISQNREKSRACACRSNDVNENVAHWKQMKDGKMKEGAAVLRLKADLSALNTVMRDPTLFRILKAKHYRHGNKYPAWPNYDFAVSIADSLQGVTHAFRSKEYELRDELYYYILDKLRLSKPFVYDFSRLNIKGTKLSKRFLLPLIERKKVEGWDDPRLPTLAGLRRRGIMPEVIKNFVLSFGLSKVESNPSIDALLAENRKLLDRQSEHFFFVANPVKLEITGNAPEKIPRNGAASNNFPCKSRNLVYISSNDVAALKKSTVLRLKDFAGVEIESIGKEFKGSFVSAPLKEGEKIIQWVFAEKAAVIPTTLVVVHELFSENESFNKNSLEKIKGFCPASAAKLKEGEIVQFERVGFARLDKKGKSNLTFIYSC